LWIAGETGNWELAKFYQHEMEETAEAVIDAHVMDEGFPVSKTMSTMLPDALDSVKAALNAKDRDLFRSRYTSLVATCNACHGAANHAFIRVAVPTGPSAFWNQDFTPTTTN